MEQELQQRKEIFRRCAMRNRDFITLWQGRWKGIYNSQSEGDLAMCRMVQKYGGNRQDADYFMRTSNLMRAKWDEKRGESTYGELTLSVVFG